MIIYNAIFISHKATWAKDIVTTIRGKDEILAFSQTFLKINFLTLIFTILIESKTNQVFNNFFF